MADSLLPDDNQQSNEREVILNKWKDKSPEELLNAKVESDLYVKTLTSRLDDLKKDYLEMKERQQASDDLKTLIDQMKKGQENPDTTHTREPVNQTAINTPEQIDTLVSKKVAEKLSEHQLSLRQQENMQFVEGKLREHLGNEYGGVYKQKLESLGLTREFADDLAKNHPSVFIKTFELENRQSSTNSAPPRSSQMNTSYKPSGAVRDWNYYQELKKANPKLYLDPKIAVQMHNDAVELGERFGMPQD